MKNNFIDPTQALYSSLSHKVTQHEELLYGLQDQIAMILEMVRTLTEALSETEIQINRMMEDNQ